MQIALSLLGAFEARAGSRVLEGGVWKLKHPRLLMQMLALASGHELYRDQVLDRLWPNADAQAGSNRLYHSLHVLRAIFTEAGVAKGQPVVVFEGGRLSLNPAHAFDIDVQRFHALIEQARRLSGAGPAHAQQQLPQAQQQLPQTQQQLLEQALTLHRGDLLGTQPSEDWWAAQREACRLEQVWALERLAGLYRSAGQPEQAQALYQRLVQAEPSNELGHRALMELFEASGHPERAVYQYTACKRYLQRDLDAQPSPQTQALVQRIVAAARHQRQAHQTQQDLAAPQQRPRYAAPPQAIALLGRQAELATLRSWLTEGRRLVSITGAAGMGKTRLAHALAEQVQDHYADGVAAVALTGLNNAAYLGEHLGEHLAGALGVSGKGEPAVQRLLAHLRSRHMLIVLDRFEHILEGAQLLGQLLLQAPRLTLLVTSQAALQLKAEQVYELPSLLQHDPQAAEQLFCAVARNAGVPIERADQRATIQAICSRLGGNALAIELAAAQTPLLAPQQILAALQHPLALLTNPVRDAEQQHRSLREAIEWSHGLLQPDTRRIFALLGVFASPFTQNDAHQVLAGFCSADEVRAALQQLLGRHLIAHASQPPACEQVVRFAMLDSLQQFAREEAARSGTWQAVRAAHAKHFAHKVQACFESLSKGKDAAAARAAQSHAGDTLMALEWHAHHADNTQFLRLNHQAGMLDFYATGSVHVLGRLEAALRGRVLAGVGERCEGAWCHYLLARGYAWQAQHARSIRAIRRARQLARGCADARLDGKIESHFALQRMHQLRFKLVRYHLERRIHGDGAGNDTADLAKAYCVLSFVLSAEGDHRAAIEAAGNGLNRALAGGHLQLTLLAHYRVSVLTLSTGDTLCARAVFEPCLLLTEQASAVAQYMLRMFDALLNMHAAEFDMAAAKLAELQQHPIVKKNKRIGAMLAMSSDFVAIEDGRFDDVSILDRLDDRGFPFDGVSAELYVGLWCYKLRLHAHRHQWASAVQCIERLSAQLRRTHNSFWYAMLFDACCHALIAQGEFRAGRRILAQSQSFIAHSGWRPTPMQVRGWSRIESAIAAGLGAAAHRSDAAVVRGPSAKALEQLQQCVRRAFGRQPPLAEPAAAAVEASP
jgi:predicted ATPase/DNA-binding SARP family transcriptional activator